MKTSTENAGPERLIALLNAIDVGEFETIEAKLLDAHQACLDLAQPELADKLDEARRALRRADMKTYRKRVETVVSRLGHLR